MDTQDPKGDKAAPLKNSLVVKVRYIAAKKQFVDPKASEKETLGELKPRVLSFFGLIEGNVNGGTKTYQYVLNGVVLTDLSSTLGLLAKGKREIDFDLVERFEQG